MKIFTLILLAIFFFTSTWGQEPYGTERYKRLSKIPPKPILFSNSNCHLLDFSREKYVYIYSFQSPFLETKNPIIYAKLVDSVLKDSIQKINSYYISGRTYYFNRYNSTKTKVYPLKPFTFSLFKDAIGINAIISSSENYSDTSLNILYNGKQVTFNSNTKTYLLLDTISNGYIEVSDGIFSNNIEFKTNKEYLDNEEFSIFPEQTKPKIPIKYKNNQYYIDSISFFNGNQLQTVGYSNISKDTTTNSLNYILTTVLYNKDGTPLVTPLKILIWYNGEQRFETYTLPSNINGLYTITLNSNKTSASAVYKPILGTDIYLKNYLILQESSKEISCAYINIRDTIYHCETSTYTINKNMFCRKPVSKNITIQLLKHPDIVLEKEVQMQTDGTLIFTINSNEIPQKKEFYWISILDHHGVCGAAGLFYNHKEQTISYSKQDSTILIQYKDKRKSINKNAKIIYYFGSQIIRIDTVILPKKIIVPYFANTIMVACDSLYSLYSLDTVSSQIKFVPIFEKDKVSIQLQNPYNIPVWIKFYKNKELIQSGLVKDFTYTNSNLYDYSISYQYIWNGKMVNDFKHIHKEQHRVNIELQTPDTVATGETIKISCKVIDNNGSIARNAHIILACVPFDEPYGMLQPYVFLDNTVVPNFTGNLIYRKTTSYNYNNSYSSKSILLNYSSNESTSNIPIKVLRSDVETFDKTYADTVYNQVNYMNIGINVRDNYLRTGVVYTKNFSDIDLSSPYNIQIKNVFYDHDFDNPRAYVSLDYNNIELYKWEKFSQNPDVYHSYIKNSLWGDRNSFMNSNYTNLNIHTDNNGIATIYITMPNQPGKWNIQAIINNYNNASGSVESTIITK